MILLTTSRRPTRGIRTFCNELSNTFPNIWKINRGKLGIDDLASKALELGAQKFVVVDRWKGGPGKIELYRIIGRGLQPVPPLIYLTSVKLRRELQTMPKGRRIKSLAITASSRRSTEINRLVEALSNFFDIPIVSSKDELSGHSVLMQIILNQTGGLILTFRLLQENVEIGPRMRISNLIWDLTVHAG